MVSTFIPLITAVAASPTQVNDVTPVYTIRSDDSTVAYSISNHYALTIEKSNLDLPDVEDWTSRYIRPVAERLWLITQTSKPRLRKPRDAIDTQTQRV